MGVAARAILGYGLLFDPEKPGAGLIWAKLAGFAQIEIEVGEDFSSVPTDHLDEIKEALEEEGFEWTECGSSDLTSYLIGRHDAYEARHGYVVEIALSQIVANHESGPELIELAEKIGMKKTDVKWHLTSFWG